MKLLLLLLLIFIAPQIVDGNVSNIYMFDIDECYERTEQGGVKTIEIPVTCTKYSQVYVFKALGGYILVDRERIKNACDINRYNARKSVHVTTSDETRNGIISRYDLVAEDVPKNINTGDVLLICPHTGEKQRAMEAQKKEIEELIDKKLELQKQSEAEAFEEIRRIGV
jgi:glutamine amidotransferase-like uncharacterized protein